MDGDVMFYCTTNPRQSDTISETQKHKVITMPQCIIASECCDDWLSATVVNCTLVAYHPTTRFWSSQASVVGSTISGQNRATAVHVARNGVLLTMNHVPTVTVNSRPLTKPDRDILRLHSADKAARELAD